jgi:antibiotic biosynthesis monooxygenase (ABM) superfamily enzyme
VTSPPAAPPATGTDAVNIVTETRVQPEHAADFARWQQHLNEVIATFPGFIDHEIIPPDPPAQVDWVIIQRFANVDAAHAWLNSETREKLLAEALPWLVGPDDIHLIASDATLPPPASESAVISARVKPGQEDAFRGWAQRIAVAEGRYPGYQGTKVTPPIPGIQDDWVTIVRFDNHDHLNSWLQSMQRKKLLDEAKDFTADVHYRTVRSGFEQWFQVGAGANAPVWKQNMLTLLALYPVVFLFGLLVQTPILQERLGLPFFLSLFISNVAGIIILNWLVPWLSQRFAWWLNPAISETGGLTTRGVVMVVALYLLMLVIFSQLHPL